MTHINETELLNYVRQNAEAALNGIEMVENSVKGKKLKTTIEAQRNEYTNLYAEADALLRRKNGTPEDMSTMSKVTAQVMGNMKKLTYQDDRDVADSMINGTVMGINKLTKHMHEYNGSDTEITSLANKVISFEEGCIEELKPFL